MFRSQGALYSVDAELVLEVVELPALSVWPGAPSGVVGVIDYRGEVLPVLDVACRLGGEPVEPGPDDELIMVETPRGRAALLVSQALELNSELTLRPVTEESPGPLRPVLPFLSGLGSYKDKVVLGLDLARVMDLPRDGELHRAPLADPSNEVLSRRAIELAAPVANEVPDGGRALVLVLLCGELLGIPVEEVAELTHCPPMTPVPGAPPHLLGLAYHRGGLLRLVDIRERCGLESGGSLPASVVILSGPGMLTGLLVDTIESVATVPGTGPKVAYRDRWVTVLDTERLAVREPR